MTEILSFESMHSLSEVSYFEEVIELSSDDEALLAANRVSDGTSSTSTTSRLKNNKQRNGAAATATAASQASSSNGATSSDDDFEEFVEEEFVEDEEEYIIEEEEVVDDEEEIIEEYVDENGDEMEEWESQLAGEEDDDEDDDVDDSSNDDPNKHRKHNKTKRKNNNNNKLDEMSASSSSEGSFDDNSTAYDPDQPPPPPPTQEELLQRYPSFNTEMAFGKNSSDHSIDMQDAFELQLPCSNSERKSRQMSALTCDWDMIRDEMEELQDCYASSVDDFGINMSQHSDADGRQQPDPALSLGDESSSAAAAAVNGDGKTPIVITFDQKLVTTRGSGYRGGEVRRGTLSRNSSGGLIGVRESRPTSLKRNSSGGLVGLVGGAAGARRKPPQRNSSFGVLHSRNLGTLAESGEDGSHHGEGSTIVEDTPKSLANTSNQPSSTVPPQEEPTREKSSHSAHSFFGDDEPSDIDDNPMSPSIHHKDLQLDREPQEVSTTNTETNNVMHNPLVAIMSTKLTSQSQDADDEGESTERSRYLDETLSKDKESKEEELERSDTTLSLDGTSKSQLRPATVQVHPSSSSLSLSSLGLSNTMRTIDYDDDSSDDDEVLPECVRSTTKIQTFSPMPAKPPTSDSTSPRLPPPVPRMHQSDSKLAYEHEGGNKGLPPQPMRRPRPPNTSADLEEVTLDHRLAQRNHHSAPMSLHDSTHSAPEPRRDSGNSTPHASPRQRRYLHGSSPRNGRLAARRGSASSYTNAQSESGPFQEDSVRSDDKSRRTTRYPQSPTKGVKGGRRNKISRFEQLLERSSHRVPWLDKGH